MGQGNENCLELAELFTFDLSRSFPCHCLRDEKWATTESGLCRASCGREARHQSVPSLKATYGLFLLPQERLQFLSVFSLAQTPAPSSPTQLRQIFLAKALNV